LAYFRYLQTQLLDFFCGSLRSSRMHEPNKEKKTEEKECAFHGGSDYFDF